MCVVANRIATNWKVYTNSCVPKHIIYRSYDHRKGNCLIAILKKKTHWYQTIEFKTKIKEKTVQKRYVSEAYGGMSYC